VGRQQSLFDVDAPTAPAAPTPSAYTIARCVCGTRVVIGRGVVVVGCPNCRQIVSGVLATSRT
jgi:hypothetical protein